MYFELDYKWFEVVRTLTKVRWDNKGIGRKKERK